MHAGMTIQHLLREAEQQLAVSATPRLDAEILLCTVLKSERAKLYAESQQVLSADRVMQYQDLIARRRAKNPVAYLTGMKEFWSMSLHVNEHTLIPRPETETLVEAALEHIPADTPSAIADLGTGSGAIALAIARERPQCRITATDISPAALAVAQDNATRHQLNNIHFVVSHWFENIHERFDLIVSNPPYIPDQDQHLQGDGVVHEPRLALRGGKDGLEAIRTIIRYASGSLQPHGWLLLEHGYDQAAAIRDLFKAAGYTDVNTYRDFAGLERVTGAQRAA